MEGGIALLLLLLVVLLVGGIALGLSGTGGFLWWRKTDPEADRLEGDDRRGERPQHTRPTTRAQQRTDFVGGDD